MKRSPVKPTHLTPDKVREIEAAVFSVAEKNLDVQFYLLDVTLEKEAGYWYLRLYVEQREGAISLSDCEAISRHLEPLIEPLPVLDDLSYNLEVSSPGLFRPLRRQREFDFYIGRPVRVEDTPAKNAGAKKAKHVSGGSLSGRNAVEGTLQAYDPAQNTLTIKRQQDEQIFEVPLDESKVAYLNPVIHFPEEDEEVELAEPGENHEQN